MYYAQPLKGSTAVYEEGLGELLEFVHTPVDERSIPGEQVKSKTKEAMSVVSKYLNDNTEVVYGKRSK